MYVWVGIHLSDRAFSWQVQNSLMRKAECWYEWCVFAVSILMVSVLQRSWLELGETACLVQGGPSTHWTSYEPLSGHFAAALKKLCSNCREHFISARPQLLLQTCPTHNHSRQTASAWEDHSRRDEPWRFYMIQAGQSEEDSPVT